MVLYNLALIGFGNVGQALVRLLQDRQDELRARYAIEWRVTGLMTRGLGYRADPAGFDPFALLAGAATPRVLPEGTTTREWLRAAHAHVVFDASSLNAQTGEPAISYLRAALESGIAAITANKGPVVHAYHTLRDLAAAHGSAFRFEATVLGGAPVFSLFRRTLPALTVQGFRGILNSTTNLILAEMEAGRSFEEGVRVAQALGLVETDPSADIDGWDAAVKVSALAQVVMEAPMPLASVKRRGIRDLDPAAVRTARAAGTPYKLVCQASRRDGRVVASVGPEQVPLSDPLAWVGGGDSLVRFDLAVLNGLSIGEHDPTPTTTAYGMLADFIDVTSPVDPPAQRSGFKAG